MKDNTLVFIKNDTPLTTSRTVAERFDKPHNDVMKSIRRLIDDIKDEGKISYNFILPDISAFTFNPDAKFLFGK